jgi:hypothetical protein
MSDVSLGGKPAGDVVQEKQKMIYLNIPTAISMIVELGDSKNIKKYSDPIIASIKQSLTNKEFSKILCGMFGVKTNKKFSKTKPNEFKMLTEIFGDIWGLKK